MKKTVLSMITILMAALVLTGCGWFAKANAVVLYGEEKEVLNAVDKEKDELVEEEQHKIKIFTNEEQRIMVLTKDTAQALVEKKLIREITDQEKAKTKVISSLPKVSNGDGLLFAKEESQKFETENQDINIKYAGNLIIGEGRVYADMFLIVNDEDWVSLKGTEKTMAILKYDKDPSAEGLKYDVEKTQLVRIQD